MNYSHLKIFQGIDSNVVSEIISESSTRTYMIGETIISEGDYPNGEWYIITSGSVQISTENGAEHILSQGDIFGEMALLNEEARTASVVAIDELTVIVLSQEILLHLMWQNESSLSKEIMKRMEENLED